MAELKVKPTVKKRAREMVERRTNLDSENLITE